MNWSEVRKLDQHPLVEIGSHSHTHPYLPSLNRIEIINELLTSKRILEKKLKHRVNKLAYPYGGSNRFTRLASRLMGYSTAFGTHSDFTLKNQMNLARKSLLELNEE
jgi:peptidoglycan/xylan/chitin deacetylase (PgdA/CDA1 family)